MGTKNRATAGFVKKRELALSACGLRPGKADRGRACCPRACLLMLRRGGTLPEDYWEREVTSSDYRRGETAG